MSVAASERDRVTLAGNCPSEDAEVLLQRLLAAPDAAIDLRDVDEMHAAVVQVLMAAGRAMTLPPPHSAVGAWLHAIFCRE